MQIYSLMLLISFIQGHSTFVYLPTPHSFWAKCLDEKASTSKENLDVLAKVLSDEAIEYHDDGERN